MSALKSGPAGSFTSWYHLGMHFDWSVRTLREWNELYRQTTAANWMQTWAYAQASFKTDHLTSQLALIKDDSENPIGLMCVQTVGLGPFKIVNLKRGPLWFKTPDAPTLAAFAVAFRAEFPKTLFQRLRWMPEYNFLEDSATQTVESLVTAGFKLRKEYFSTSWIDLSRTEADLRSGLQQKWRNCLSKSEKQNLIVRADQTLNNLPLFFRYYQQHLRTKKYFGPTVKFLNEEFVELSKSQDIIFLWALDSGKAVASVAIVLHGTTASYRLGWNTADGRKKNAHYLLLWQAILKAKSLGYQKFDLGGLLPEEAPGITHFKMGLGGQVSKTVTLA